ncbi:MULTISPECIES: ABC transporter permease [unclassified Coleofasciculus]|uniref:ABC transporter permease n=1 Tax=unclassified Coleofasciculus TaxID=2692782 RepID=UPI001880D877|nr:MULTISPECIES: ABC transporter permease [unclassified Coleofasciculus]MBE9128439.1 ABC transporter permease [Coleofasciculus sp. LEGE 07081]MBE9149404.1 ABC transporter permease [Coleofasciculus sp. LEGE 07092]
MNYIIQNPENVFKLLLEHLKMTALTMAVAVAIALPLSLLITRYRWLNVPVLGVLGTLYTIPSLALIILLVPIFGLNRQSVVVAMIVYTQVILVRNFSVALQSVEPTILEASRGMGMNSWQRWWWVQVPLILPICLAGVRLATIVAIAIATIGAKFGAGGLGVLLFEGVAQTRYDKIWTGAIAVAVLAFFLNSLLLGLQWLSSSTRKVIPPGLFVRH